jgi:hypothetical protein
MVFSGPKHNQEIHINDCLFKSLFCLVVFVSNVHRQNDATVPNNLVRTNIFTRKNFQ